MLGVGGRVKPATSGSSSTSIGGGGGGGGSSGSSDIISASVRQQQQERQQAAGPAKLEQVPAQQHGGIAVDVPNGGEEVTSREGGREGKSATSANMNRCS